jgi:hypothetical protein
MVLGISVDSTDSHKEFCAKQGLTFKLLADSDKKVVQQSGSLRNLVVFRVAARNTFLVGPNGKIAKIWTCVDPGRHSAEVFATLAELQARSSGSTGGHVKPQYRCQFLRKDSRTPLNRHTLLRGGLELLVPARQDLFSRAFVHKRIPSTRKPAFSRRLL